MSYFDIAVIVIVALFALLGLWKGFFKTLISFFGWTVSFLIAFFITKPVANALLDVGKIRQFVIGGGGGWSLYQWISGKWAADAGSFMLHLLEPLVKTSLKAGVDPSIGVPLLLANGMFSVIVCIGLFLIIRLLMLIFTLFVNSITKGKFKGALSRFLGFLFGAVKGSAWVCIIMVFLSFMMGLSFMSPVRAQVDKSVIAQPVYKQVVKFTDKYLAGDTDTLNKLMQHLGSGEKKPDNTPAYVGTYKGTDTSEGSVTSYTLDLRKDGSYELAIADADIGDTSYIYGRYEWDEANRKLYLISGGSTEDYDILDDGSIDYDENTRLVKVSK